MLNYKLWWDKILDDITKERVKLVFGIVVSIIAMIILTPIITSAYPDATIFVTLGLLIVTAYYAIVTREISIATLRNSEIAKTTLLANIELKIMRDYARPKMLKAMNKLRHFKDPEKFDDTIQGRENLNLEFLKLKSTNPMEFEDLDAARRLVSHHFQIIYKLWNIKAINNETLENLVEKGQAEFYLEIIEPLEGGKGNPNYHRESFNKFRTLYPGLDKYEEMNWK